MRSRRLRRVVVDEADRRQAELAVAHDLAQHQPPAVAGAGDQHAALVLAPAAKRRQRAALVECCARARARRRRKTSASRAKSTITPIGSPIATVPWLGRVLTGRSIATATTVSSDDRNDRARDRLVVALARVAPAALVDARQHEHRQAARSAPTRSCVRAGARSRPSGRCRSAAGRRGSTRARPAPRPPRAGAARDGAGERPPSGSVGALCQIVRGAWGVSRAGRQPGARAQQQLERARADRGARVDPSPRSARARPDRAAPARSAGAGGLRRSAARRRRPARPSKVV